MKKEIIYTKEQRDIFDLKTACHNQVLRLSKTKKDTQKIYSRLSRKLNLRPQDCHFSLMDKSHLKKALAYLESLEVLE